MISKIKKNVLLIEDDIEMASLMKMSLDSDSVNIILAHEVTEALGKLQNQKFDCLILDIMLKNSSSTRIIDHLIAANKLVPILMISGNISKNILLKYRSYITAAFTKPVDMDLIEKKLKAIFKSN